MSRFSSLLISMLCSHFFGVKSNPSVIVIGAGPSGVAAATKLLENGVANLKILEAENRIGGRIHSVKFGDAFVDLGAEFCHGETGNIVYNLVKDLNVLESFTKNPNLKLYYSNGSEIDPLLSEELQTIALNYGDFETNINSTGMSLGEFLPKLYNSVILKKYEDDADKLKVLKKGLHFIESLANIEDGSFSWFNTSAQYHYEACEGDNAYSWKGRGYKTILEVLMKSYSDPSKKLDIDDKIHLNKIVSKIKWKDNEKIVVECSDNTSYFADHVIFTPSIGVLKAKESQLFVPQLLSSKKAVIETTGFDGIMKIIMHFPRKWWHDNDSSLAFLWSEEDLRNLTKKFPRGPVKDGQSWVSAITVLTQAPNNSNVLIALLTGSFIPEIEQMSFQDLEDGVIYVLKKFLGKDYDVSVPDQIIRSSWCTNPNFRGTYSYEKVGFYKKEISTQAILAEPLKNSEDIPVVLFAGEATHSIYYSTVHGAIETGFREAERIINLYRK